ncbi:hypothetical protein [Flavisolibacter nicotianae]|uniref:hypothetical protein n=1 Tax=Flavisolibacter nicotianae TaxID=2364882 RepID=UPI000EB07B21|nr:hypothetical protein [Flavisolibacter nicotianae]
MMNRLTLSVAFASIIALASCKKSDDQTVPTGNTPAVGSTIDVRGTINTSTTWKKDYVYRLRGYVYVTGGATLTIEPGTKIVSNRDSAGVLVIYRDAKIMADGSASSPIVFTSAEANPQPGDLGGLVIAGQATSNGNHSVMEGGLDPAFSAFGGTNDAHNSGVVRYVRIEYAGKAVNPGDEVNGLSLYAVGSGTTIDYVEVVRGLDDAYEFFGGTVNCKHLIAYNSADDDFDMDDGYRGKIQFGISIKDPKFTDNKGTTGDVSNNFEVDNVNPSNGFLLTRTPITFPVLSNFTAIGPNGATGTSADYGWGMRWRRGAKFILANSVVVGGQKGGLRLQEDSTVAAYVRGTSAFYNSLVQAVINPIDVQSGLALAGGTTYDLASVTAQTTGAYKSTVISTAADAKITDPFNNGTPNLKPAAGSPLLAGALFDFGTLSDTFFEKVSFRGAVDPNNDWTAGWTVWNK